MKDIIPQEFDSEVLRSDVPVVVDFWTTSCAPCRGLAKTLEAIETERSGTLRVVTANVQAHPEFASRFGVMSVPTLMVFSGGKLMGKHVGAGAKATINSKIDTILKQ